MPQLCPNCGRDNRDTGKYCAYCNTQLMGLLGSNTRLQNRYRIVKVLGCGGMGAVYLAEDERLGPKKVAVKENFDISSQAQQQFQFEAHILANLDHPHLPKVTDHFIESSGRQYLVMEYVEGEDLESLRHRQGQLDEAQVLAWAEALLDALEYLHTQSKPVIHRDIKPANIKLTPQGKIKLVDFGIAKIHQPGQATYTVARASGSPGFAPVEQYIGGTDARSDIYSLGATLYCLLTGQTPPESAALAAGQPLTPPRKIRSDLAPHVQALIFQAMAVDINQRFQTAAQMRQSLHKGAGSASGQSPPARRRKKAKPVKKTGLRSWQWFSVGCGTLMLLAICAATGYFGLDLLEQEGISIPATTTTPMAMVTPSVPVDETPDPAEDTSTPADPSLEAVEPSPIPDTPTPTNTPFHLPSPVSTEPPSPTPTKVKLPTEPAQPVPTANSSTAFKQVGETYEANGLSLTLLAYNIESDGSIWLKFGVANQGTQRVLLRYQNNYFSVSDDTGKSYPQDEDFLVEPKQYELAPEQSFEIDGDNYAGEYREVGLFYGKVPEQASRLIVKVTQFGELQDMQWQIPLNPQLAKPQAPSPGTQQPVLEGFSANGIMMLLSDYSIDSDGETWLKFVVRNEGNNAVLLRYQNKYFELYDDLGNRYEQDEDFLLEPKQFLLAPGKSFEIDGDNYAGEYREVGLFYGKVPEQASRLIVKVTQFGDLQDMQWQIPLNPQLAKPQAPSPGTQQPVLEGFSANGIMMLLSDYSIDSDGETWLKFVVRNEGNNAVLLRYQNKYFELYDDLDNRYDQDEDFLLEPKQLLLAPGKSFEIDGDSYADKYHEVGLFYGKVPEQASRLIVKVTQFGDLQDMQWQIPLK